MPRYYRNTSDSDDTYYSTPYAINYNPTTDAINILDTSNSWSRDSAHYRLKEWNTSRDGTGTTYLVGGSQPSSSLTYLYAIWEYYDSHVVHATCTAIPTSYDSENSVIYGTPTNPDNGLTDSSSTSYGQFSLARGSSAETSVYYNLEGTSIIPDGAIIDLLKPSQYKCYISNTSSYIDTRKIQLCTINESETTSLCSATVSDSTDQTTFNTYAPFTTEDVKNLKVRAYAVRGTSNTSANYYFRFYGFDTVINYTYYTIPCTIYSDVTDVTVDSNTFDAIENQNNSVTISNPYGKKIAIYDNGVITETTSATSYTYTFFATEAHNIIIQENYFYVKPNGKWLTGQAAYKKVSGSWVEQSNLSTVFTNQENYEYKGDLLYTENPFFSAFGQMDLVANVGYGDYSDDGIKGNVRIDLTTLQQNVNYYALGSYADKVILSKFVYSGTSCTVTTEFINFVNGSGYINLKPVLSTIGNRHYDYLYLSPNASTSTSTSYSVWGGTLLVFKIKENSTYTESQIDTIFSTPPTITVKVNSYGEGPGDGFTMTNDFYCMVMWQAYFAMDYVYNDTHTRVRLIGNAENYTSSVSNTALLAWYRNNIMFSPTYQYVPSLYNSETALGSIGASVSVFQIS